MSNVRVYFAVPRWCSLQAPYSVNNQCIPSPILQVARCRTNTSNSKGTSGLLRLHGAIGVGPCTPSAPLEKSWHDERCARGRAHALCDAGDLPVENIPLTAQSSVGRGWRRWLDQADGSKRSKQLF